MLKKTFCTSNSKLKHFLEEIKSKAGLPEQIQDSFSRQTRDGNRLERFLLSSGSQAVFEEVASFIINDIQNISESTKRNFVEKNKESFVSFDKIKREESGGLNINCIFDDENKNVLKLSVAFNNAAGALLIKTLYHIDQNELSEATKTLLMIFDIGAFLKEYPTAHSFFAILHINSLGLKGVSIVCEHGKAQNLNMFKDLNSAVQEALFSISSVADVYRAERAYGLILFERMRVKGLEFYGLKQLPDYNIDLDQIKYLQFMDTLIKYADQPFYKVKSNLGDLYDKGQITTIHTTNPQNPENYAPATAMIAPWNLARLMKQKAIAETEHLAYKIAFQKILDGKISNAFLDPLSGNPLEVRKNQSTIVSK